MSELEDRMRADLKAAMLQRDKTTTRVVRTLLSAISNAEAQPVADASVATEGPIASSAVGVGAADVERKTLTESQLRAIVAAERQERIAVAAALSGSGQDAAAAGLRHEAEIVARYC